MNAMPSTPSAPVTLGLIVGNRGFFPSSLMTAARRQMKEVLASLGHETMMMDDLDLPPTSAAPTAR